jgi:peptide/nickel transport system substrate-binding protein
MGAELSQRHFDTGGGTMIERHTGVPHRLFFRYLLTLVALAVLTLGLACSGKGGTQKQATAPAAQIAPIERTVGIRAGLENAKPEQGGTVTRALPSDVVTLNPVVASDFTSYLAYKWIFDPLIDTGEDGKFVGVLAESWETTPDNKVTTFHLRKGVTWHDGKPFTADDVLFTYQASMDPEVDAVNKRPPFEPVAKVEKADDLTVKVTWKRPYAPGLAAWVFYIMPKHYYGYVKGEEEMFNSHPRNETPVGTGPFKFEDWKRGERLVLKANPGYFNGRPHIDELVLKVIPSPQTQMAAYKTGQLDMTGISPELWKQLKTDAAFQNQSWIFEYYTKQYFYIGWNQDGSNPFFADKKVRQAMTLALNRQGVVDKILDGHGLVTSGPFNAKGWEYNPAVKPLPHDPQKASALLDEAGWKDSDGDGIRDKGGKKFSFECLIPAEAEQFARFLELFQQDLKKVGVDLQIRKVEWGVFNDRTHRHQFQAFLSGWQIADDPDPYQLLHSSQAKLLKSGVGQGQNDCSYKNAEVDKLISEEQSTFDLEARKKAFWRLHEVVAEDQPHTFLFQVSSMAAVKNRIQNVRVSRAGYGLFTWYPSLTQWWIAKEKK